MYEKIVLRVHSHSVGPPKYTTGLKKVYSVRGMKSMESGIMFL